MVHRELFKLVNGIHRSVMRMSKENNYFPPRVNITADMSSKEMLVELEKLERFLSAPHFSYLVKDSHPDYRKK